MPSTDLPLIGINPVDNPELYDQFKLAGTWSPGICHFDAPPKRLTGWSLQVPSGTVGGVTIKNRVPPIKFSVRIELWKGDDENGGDVDHFSTWEQFKKLLVKPVKPNQPKALAIYHPLLAALQPPVTDVVVEDYNEPAPDGTGLGVVTIDFIEFRPIIIKPIVGLNGTLTGKSDPNADLKKKVADATTEFNSL